MNREAQIAERVAGMRVAERIEQGWYTGKTDGMVVLWTRVLGHDEFLNMVELSGLVKRANELQQSTISVLGSRSQMDWAQVTAIRERPAVIVNSRLLIDSAEMKPIKEGRP